MKTADELAGEIGNAVCDARTAIEDLQNLETELESSPLDLKAIACQLAVARDCEYGSAIGSRQSEKAEDKQDTIGNAGLSRSCLGFQKSLFKNKEKKMSKTYFEAYGSDVPGYISVHKSAEAAEACGEKHYRCDEPGHVFANWRNGGVREIDKKGDES